LTSLTLLFRIPNSTTACSTNETLASGSPNSYKSTYICVLYFILLTYSGYFICIRYGVLDNEEYEVVIDEKNTWKDEIMLRMSLDKAVPAEIIQMPCKYMKFKNVPYHLYPFSQYLNSTNEGHRYYILSAIAAYYKQLQSNEWYFCGLE